MQNPLAEHGKCPGEEIHCLKRTGLHLEKRSLLSLPSSGHSHLSRDQESDLPPLNQPLSVYGEGEKRTGKVWGAGVFFEVEAEGKD